MAANDDNCKDEYDVREAIGNNSNTNNHYAHISIRIHSDYNTDTGSSSHWSKLDNINGSK